MLQGIVRLTWKLLIVEEAWDTFVKRNLYETIGKLSHKITQPFNILKTNGNKSQRSFKQIFCLLHEKKPQNSKAEFKRASI